MNDQLNERWYELCQLAAVEPNSDKLLKLVAEVNFLLDVKDEARAANQRRLSARANS